jgi:hypothetical protein
MLAELQQRHHACLADERISEFLVAVIERQLAVGQRHSETKYSRTEKWASVSSVNFPWPSLKCSV